MYSRITSLQIQKERSKDRKRAEAHEVEQLTWLSTQASLVDDHEVNENDPPPPSEQSTSTNELTDIVAGLNPKGLGELVRDNSARDDFVVFLRAVFGSSPVKTKDGLERLLGMFQAVVLNLLGVNANNSSTTLQTQASQILKTDVANELLSRIHTLPDHAVALLTEKIIMSLSEATGNAALPHDRFAVESSLEIICKLVFRVANKPLGLVDPESLCGEDLSEMDGSSFRLHVIRKLCNLRWPENAIAPMLNALRELLGGLRPTASTADVLATLEKKMMRQLTVSSMNELPAVCEEIFALSSVFDDRTVALQVVLEHFESMPGTAANFKVQGQILQRFISSVSRDAKLGECYLKFLEQERKSMNWTWASLAFLLSLGRLQRFEKAAVDLVRKRAMERDEAAKRELESPWLNYIAKRMLEDEASEASLQESRQQAQDSSLDLEPALNELVDVASKLGWDLLVPMLCKLCSRLIEDAAQGMSLYQHPYLDLIIASQDENHVAYQSQEEQIQIQDASVGAVGVRVLAKCFKLFALSRSDLLMEITNRALSTDASTSLATFASPVLTSSLRGVAPLPTLAVVGFLRVLYFIARDPVSSRALFIDHATSVKDLVSLLPSLNPRVAHAALRALSPALESTTLHRDIRDHAMVVFRKALFLRDVGPRLVALYGVLTCCKDGDVDSYGATTTRSAHSDAASLSGCLRRCVTQQYEVKSALYLGIRRLNSDSTARVDLIRSHLLGELVETSDDSDLPPIRFEKCVDPTTGKIKEPIGALLVAGACGDGYAGRAIWDFSRVAGRLGNASVATFSLDKNSTFDSSLVEGQTNRSTANLVIESCEALIEASMQKLMGSSTMPVVAQDLGDVAKLWRMQRAIRRLVGGWDARDAEDSKKRSKKKKGMEEDLVDELDEEEVFGGAKKNTKPAAAAAADPFSKAAAKKNDDGLELCPEGLWLSNGTIICLLRLSIEVSVGLLLSSTTVVVPQAAVAAVPGVDSDSRGDVASLMTNLGFHEYLMLSAASKLQASRRMVKDAQATTSDLTMFGEMAQTCAGFRPTMSSELCLSLIPLSFKAFQRYASVSRLSRDNSAMAASDSREGEASTKKRKKSTAAAPPTSSDKELQKLVHLSMECVRDAFFIAGAISKTCLVDVIRSAFPSICANEPNDNVILRLGSNQMQEACGGLFESKAWPTVLVCLEGLRVMISNVDIESEELGDCANWLDHVVKKKLCSAPAVVKACIKLYLDTCTRFMPSDLNTTCESLSRSLVKEFAAPPPDGDDEDELKKRWKMIHGPGVGGASLAATALSVLMTKLHGQALDECERVMSLHPVAAFSSLRIQTDISKQIEAVCLIVAPLLRAGGGVPMAGMESILRCTLRVYKCATKLYRGCIAKKSAVAAPGALSKLANVIWKDMTPKLDEILREVEHVGTTEEGGKKSALMTKEVKLVPELVFGVEQYEFVLLKCANASLGVEHLSKCVRRTTARDFRVDFAKIKQAVDDEEDEEGGGNGGAAGEKEEEE